MLAQYLIFAAGFLVFGGSSLALARWMEISIENDRKVEKVCVDDPEVVAFRRRIGARAIVLAPVWPLAVLWLSWEFAKLSHRTADWLIKTADLPLLRPKVLPPPARGSELDEHERRIDEMIAQLERM